MILKLGKMDVQTNVGISSSGFSAPWDFLSETNKENDDSSLEWLSIYVEDCLSSGPNYYTQIKPEPKPETLPLNPKPNSDPNPINQLSKPNPNSDPDQITQQSKSSEIIKKTKKRSLSLFEEPPLLHNQTQWLADSEPIYPLTQLKPVPPNPPKKKNKTKQKNVIEKSGLIKDEKMQRRCTHCLSNKTPQWREGPMGPKTLCNACGVRFKSGRLLPEYRPAKSPTFQSFKHSNSHRKVLEMRMMATMIENNDH